jgi:hypothetical protein
LETHNGYQEEYQHPQKLDLEITDVQPDHRQPSQSNPPQNDDTYAKLKALFQWRDNVESDLSSVACREIAGEDEMFLSNIMHALEESPIGEEMISDYQRSSNPNFALLVFGARLYLAGKCSQQRYDDAAPQ